MTWKTGPADITFAYEGYLNRSQMPRKLPQRCWPPCCQIPAHKFELDQAHRALTFQHPEGPPRDIIMKPHFYTVKETVMQKVWTAFDPAAWSWSTNICGHFFSYCGKTQILQTSTLATAGTGNKVPLVLPFSLSFPYKGKYYSFSTVLEEEALLKHLGFLYISPPTSLTPQAPSTSGQGIGNRGCQSHLCGNRPKPPEAITVANPDRLNDYLSQDN